jgi:hypothetical protein
MGVRLYAPLLGRFLQTDPIYGGNPNTYTYPVDPINAHDLDGKWWRNAWNRARNFGKKWGTRLGNAASYCSWVPGAIGTACSTVSAVGYFAAGNWRAGVVAATGAALGGTGGFLLKGLKAGRRAGHIGKWAYRSAWAHVNIPRSTLASYTRGRPRPYRGSGGWHGHLRYYSTASTWG